MQRFWIAEKKGMTVWPCTCVDDMEPLERRLWPIVWAKLNRMRTRLQREREAADGA